MAHKANEVGLPPTSRSSTGVSPSSISYPPQRVGSGVPARRDGGLGLRHAYEHDLLVVAAHGVLLDVPDAGDVPFALCDARVELRGRLDCQQGVRVRAVRHGDGATRSKNPRLVEGVARVVLLAVRVALLRVAGHDDPRLLRSEERFGTVTEPPGPRTRAWSRA